MNNFNEEKVSRADFIKKGFLGILGLALASKAVLVPAEAATVRDNLGGGGGGSVTGTTPPANKSKLWIDTSVSGRGVLKYWDGTKWSATASVWDD